MVIRCVGFRGGGHASCVSACMDLLLCMTFRTKVVMRDLRCTTVVGQQAIQQHGPANWAHVAWCCALNLVQQPDQLSFLPC
eukprot:946538-Pelagomonas_calceolata.AAC.1